MGKPKAGVMAVNVYVPELVFNRIEEIATRHLLSRSDVFRNLVMRGIEQYDQDGILYRDPGVASSEQANADESAA